jgi:DNA-binding transcriptional LysR family regulator
VTAPLAETLLGEVVAECLARHPQMRLELALTDRHVDLVEEKFDLAFRTGTLKDTFVVAHERSSSKGSRPINLSRCSMRTRHRHGPSMRCMPAAVAPHRCASVPRDREEASGGPEDKRN